MPVDKTYTRDTCTPYDYLSRVESEISSICFIHFMVHSSHRRVFSLAPASKRVVQGFFDESSRLLPAFQDEVDASGCKHKTVEAMIGCYAILPTPRPHSANRPATALLLAGVSAPFAHSPISCFYRSGSLRTPKETS